MTPIKITTMSTRPSSSPARWRLLPVAAALAALVLAGCAATHGIAPTGSLREAAALEVERALADAEVDPAAGGAQWWRRFGDPQLDRLIEEGLAGSPSMDAAQARVRRAQASAELAGAARSPQLTGNAAATRERLSEKSFYPPPLGGSTVTDIRATLDFSVDFDFWGRNDALLRAALSAEDAARADAYAARTVLATGIARSYLQLDRLYAQRDIALDLLRQREHLATLTGNRVRAGLDTKVELRQSEAALPAARADVAALDESIAAARHQIAALLGAGPDRGLAIERPRLAAGSVPTLPSRVPADLLARRPDVIAAKARVAAAGGEIDAARAQFYPNVNLAAFVGLTAISFEKLTEGGSWTAGVGPAIHLPILDGGRLRANLKGKAADYDLAVAQYNQTLSDALKELADVFAGWRGVVAQKAEVSRSLAALTEAYDLAQLRYEKGLGNYLAVLSAEGQLLAQRQRLADLDARARDLDVQLAKALGGGEIRAEQVARSAAH